MRNYVVDESILPCTQVSALGSSSTTFVPVHSGAVRDIKLSRSGEYVLTASLDKTAKLTSYDRNNVVHTYACLPPCVGSRSGLVWTWLSRGFGVLNEQDRASTASTATN